MGTGWVAHWLPAAAASHCHSHSGSRSSSTSTTYLATCTTGPSCLAPSLDQPGYSRSAPRTAQQGWLVAGLEERSLPDCLEAANSAWQVSPCASIVHCHGWLAGWLVLVPRLGDDRPPAGRGGGAAASTTCYMYLLWAHPQAAGWLPGNWLAGWAGRLTPPPTWNQPEPNAPGQAEPRPAATWLLPCFTRTKPAPSWLLASRLAGGPAGGDPKEAPECLRDGGSRHATSKILGRKSRWHSCLLSGNIETGRPGASYINFN